MDWDWHDWGPPASWPSVAGVNRRCRQLPPVTSARLCWPTRTRPRRSWLHARLGQLRPSARLWASCAAPVASGRSTVAGAPGRDHHAHGRPGPAHAQSVDIVSDSGIDPRPRYTRHARLTRATSRTSAPTTDAELRRAAPPVCRERRARHEEMRHGPPPGAVVASVLRSPRHQADHRAGSVDQHTATPRGRATDDAARARPRRAGRGRSSPWISRPARGSPATHTCTTTTRRTAA